MAYKIIQMILALAVIAIGGCMLYKNGISLQTPPSQSGLAFLLVGLSLWLPNCPVCNMLCKRK